MRELQNRYCTLHQTLHKVVQNDNCTKLHLIINTIQNATCFNSKLRQTPCIANLRGFLQNVNYSLLKNTIMTHKTQDNLSKIFALTALATATFSFTYLLITLITKSL